MEEQCPICSRSFPSRFLERHVNTCLDTLEVSQNASVAHHDSPSSSDIERKTPDAFAALGLKADSSRSRAEKSRKASATLTSILLAEKRLKRKQEELENLNRKQQSMEQPLPGDDDQTLTENVGKPESHSYTSSQTGKDSVALPSGSRVLTESQQNLIQQSQESADDRGTSSPDVNASSSPLSSTKIEEFRRFQQEVAQLKREAELPLAQRLRPDTLNDFFGQDKLVGPHGMLRNFLESNQLPSFILWGVPGVGKTSLARIIASSSDRKLVELSGSDSNARKLKEAFANAQTEKNLTGQKTVLFLDEIHRFNKAVQDLLLPVIEKGVVTVIGATTENPSFTLNNALLSRMHTFVMEPLSHEALVKILNKGLLLINKTRKFVYGLHLIAIKRDAVDYIASLSGGDSRVALNILESINAYLSGLQYKIISKKEPNLERFDMSENIGVVQVTLEHLKPLLSSRNFHQMYDKSGENHYDTISAFHKSVRGSNADAAIFYLVKMLSGGEDPLFIARRMVVIASEDIGLRDSSCLPFAISAMEALQFIGMPEGEIILAHCAVKLAKAPKSTKSYRALRKAQTFLRENPDVMKLPIPLHLRNAPTSLMKELGYGETYKYNPNYKHGLIEQSFMPPEIHDVAFVDSTHLGELVDEEVEQHEYEKYDKEEEEYRQFKKLRRGEIQQQMADYRRKSKARNALSFVSSQDQTERLSSYDENLSKDDQPEYFEGTEQDAFSDHSDASDRVNCSYDEYLGDV